MEITKNDNNLQQNMAKDLISKMEKLTQKKKKKPKLLVFILVRYRTVRTKKTL